jgi:hypothetical protein
MRLTHSEPRDGDMPRSRPTRSDAGQSLLLLMGLVASIGVAIVGLAQLGAVLVHRAQARSAADAAALAGTSGGRAAAADAAARNGAVLVSFWSRGDLVVVEVVVSAVHATASATDSP